MKQSEYIPHTPRETMESYRRLLKRQAGGTDMAKALLVPAWIVGKAPGTERMEYARLGDFTLYAAKTTEAQHRTAPNGAARISWSLASEKEGKVTAGGGAASLEDAKEFAYLVYQAAQGFIRGGDA